MSDIRAKCEELARRIQLQCTRPDCGLCVEDRRAIAAAFLPEMERLAEQDHIKDLHAQAELKALQSQIERLIKADETRVRDISRLTIERDEARARVERLVLALVKFVKKESQ